MKTSTYNMYQERRNINLLLMLLSRLCVNNIPPPPTLADRMIVALRPAVEIPPEIYERLTEVHNSNRGHGRLKLCNHRLKEIQKLQRDRLDMHLPPQDKISTRMINEFIRQCPYCQISNRLKIPIKTHPFTCASYNPPGSHRSATQGCTW